MSIKNPSTYGEWWWAQNVDASKQFNDDKETVLQPYIAGLVDLVADLDGMPPELLAPLKAVGQAGHFGVADIAVGASSASAQSGLMAGLSPLLRGIGQSANKKWKTNFISTDIASVLASRNKATGPLWLSRAYAEGYTEDEASLIYDYHLPFPDIMSLMQWARYVTDGNETFTKVQTKQDIPDDEFPIWDFITTLRLNTAEVQQLYVRGFMNEDQAKLELRRDGYRDFDVPAIMDLAYQIPNASYLLQAALMQDKREKDLIDVVTLTGIHPDHAQAYIDASLAKPNASDLIRYMLRDDPNLSNLEQELLRLGVHPKYLDVFKVLAYPVPPIGDMITMAVREAFTPDIASRFGQYEDYPADLTKFAAMNGIDENWCKRYWAAHWSLPSPQQGFAMYQRGIITEDELHLLLRALDIMPYWRDKLTELAYNPLTRVDVRRMFQVGALTADEVEKAYRDAGYSPDNARRLRDFVQRDTIRSQSGMSITKIVTAYKSGITPRDDAYNAILSTGVRADMVSDILNRADIQLQWQRTKDAIAGIRNLYKIEEIKADEARNRLAALRLDGLKINTLMEQWDRDTAAERKELWTRTDVLAMHKAGIITTGRAAQELALLGYNDERVAGLIALSKPKK